MSLLDTSLPSWILVIQLAILEVLILINIVRLRTTVFSFLNGFQDPEKRESLWKEISHGVMRAVGERQGAVKGAASRQMEATLGQDVSGLAISGLASFLPKKYQAFAPLLAPYIQQFIGQQMPQLQGSNGQQSSSQGQPP